MGRLCFWCHKPLPIEQRATVFCSRRCQELEAQMRARRQAADTGAATPASRGTGSSMPASSGNVPSPQQGNAR